MAFDDPNTCKHTRLNFETPIIFRSAASINKLLDVDYMIAFDTREHRRD
jgi:hypothetical protein